MSAACECSTCATNWERKGEVARLGRGRKMIPTAWRRPVSRQQQHFDQGEKRKHRLGGLQVKVWRGAHGSSDARGQYRADTHRESDHRFVIGSVKMSNGQRRSNGGGWASGALKPAPPCVSFPQAARCSPCWRHGVPSSEKAGPGRPPGSRPENPRQELTVAGEPTAGDLQNPRWRLLYRGFRTVG